MQEGSSSGTTPRPFGLVSSPAPRRRTSSFTSSTAPAAGTPPPAQTMGRRDPAMISAARATSPPSGVPADAGEPANWTGSSSNTGDAYWKSIGISTDTGPRRDVMASTTACAIVAAMAPGDGGRWLAFESVAIMASWSGTSWMKPRCLPRNRLSIWPVRCRTGDDDTQASSWAPMAFAAPGPVDVRHTPSRPVVRANPSAAPTAPCS